MSHIIPEPNDNFSHGHFEYCYVFLAQKLTILEYISKYKKYKKKVGHWLAKIRLGGPVYCNTICKMILKKLTNRKYSNLGP